MKMSHKESNYRPASSTTKRCGTCTMYRGGAPPSCTLVIRPIRPTMVCDYYKGKDSEAKKEAA